MKRFIIEQIQKDTLNLLTTECPDLACGGDDAWYEGRAEQLKELEEYGSYLFGQTEEWSTEKLTEIHDSLKTYTEQTINIMLTNALYEVDCTLDIRLDAEFMNAREAR